MSTELKRATFADWPNSATTAGRAEREGQRHGREVVLYRTDTGEEVSKREATKDELQESIAGV